MAVPDTTIANHLRGTTDDAINITITGPNPPNNLKIGDVVKVKLEIKSQYASIVGTNRGFTAYVHACKSNVSAQNCQPVKVINGTGLSTSGNDTFVVSSSNFQVGNNIIHGLMSYQFLNTQGLPYTRDFEGQINLTVEQSSVSSPTVRVNLRGPCTSVGATGSKLSCIFDIIYIAPSGAINPSSYNIDCGSSGANSGQLTAQSLTSFTCEYNKASAGSPPVTYTGKVEALDAQGNKIPGAETTFTVTIDDKTGHQPGPGSVGESDTGSFFDLFAPIITIVNIVLGVILGILRWVMWFLGTTIFVPLLETTLSLDANSLVTGAVTAGWVYIRDIVNMFFILVLIIIGFGTMLRLESYSYKKLLVNLIMMALLVNFSLVIGRIIIQIADAAQFSFLTLDSSGNIVGVRELFKRLNATQLGSVLDGFRSFFGNISSGADASAALTATFSLFMQFMLELGVIITFAAMAIFMLIRTVVIWALLILSPAAYALAILPATASLANKWWTNFIKYVIFAPLFAFFLKLTEYIYTKGIGINTSAQSLLGDKDLITALNDLSRQQQIDFKTLLELLMLYVLVLGFLWAGLLITKQLGIAGAGAIVGMATKGLMMPLKGTGWLTGAGVGAFGQWYAHKTQMKANAASEQRRTKTAMLWKIASFLNPKTVKEAWQQRTKEKEEEAYGPAVGAMRDTLNRIMPTEWKVRIVPVFNKETGKWEQQTQRLGRKTYFEKIATEQIINKKAKEINEANLSEDERVAVRHGATNWIEAVAAEKALITNRHEDGEAITRMKAEGRAPEDAIYDAVRYQMHVFNDLLRKGLTREQAGEQKMHMSEMAEGQGKLREAGSAETDVDGVIRSAADFEGLRAMARFTGVDGLGRNGEQQFIAKLQEYGVLNGQNEFVDKNGHMVATINNIDDFNRVLQNTENEDDTTGRNLQYELVGARMAANINKRVQRGSAELVAGGIEPAAFLQQKGDGKWGGYTSYGRNLMRRLTPTTAASFIASRAGQGRALRLLGINQKDDGSWDYQNINQETLLETARLNPNIAHAILVKNRMAHTDAQGIETMLHDNGINNIIYDDDRGEWKLT